MVDAAGRFRAEGLAGASWANGPGDRYAAHAHDYDKVIVVVAGSIMFGLGGGGGGGGSVELEVGDRLDLPAGTVHDASVGAMGVACLEAHLPAGRFDALARRAAGAW